jgi:hypothetical protein
MLFETMLFETMLLADKIKVLSFSDMLFIKEAAKLIQ